MAISIQDLQPYINQNSFPPQQSNLPLANYSPQGVPTSGGLRTRTTQSPLNNILNVIDPSNAILPGFSQATGINLGSLFGFGGSSTKPSWSPYYDPSSGLYYSNDPRQVNPTPLTHIPGAGLAEGRIYQRSANQVRTINDLLPYLTNAVNAQQLPTELTNLQTSQITSPGYAQLMTDLYNNYGPQLNAIGNEIQNRNALAQAQTSQDVINGPGRGLVNSAYDLSQVFDKPWYDTRGAAANSIQKLLGSIDLSGKPSGSEVDQLQSSIARQNVQRGTNNAPSNTDVTANAMQFGNLGYQRKQTAISNLSDAISKASAFLPSAKSGVDVFQVATGRSSMPNPGNSLFPGISNPSNNNAFGLAGNLLGSTGQQINTTQQIDAQKKDWLDQFNQLTSGIGNLVGAAGKGASLFGM